jgi:hypothetical protein
VIKGGISVWSFIKTCHIVVLRLDKIVNSSNELSYSNVLGIQGGF